METVLRAWRREDAAQVAQCADNGKIARFLRDAFPHPYTLADAQAYVDGCVAADETDQLCRAIVVDGRAVGSIGLFRGRDVYRRSAELGYWLAEPYWGRGIMTRGVESICREGFAAWEDLVRIYAEPFAHNAGSRRVLEKAGFALEGVMRRGVCKNGQLYDSCMYALLREAQGV